MREFFGSLFIVLGLMVVFLVGWYFCFCGGLLQILQSTRGIDLVQGIIRMLLSGPVSWLLTYIFIRSGFILLDDLS